METGKTGKYLKYAIGEIVLVVIGILIALQINNWNQNRIQSIEERGILKNLNTEFRNNRAVLKNDIESNLNTMITGQTLMGLMGSDETILKTQNTDSLLFMVFDGGNVNFSENTVLELVQSGKFQILKSETLKNLIFEWTQNQKRAVEINEARDRVNNILIDYLYNKYPVKNIDIYGTLQWKQPSRLKVNKLLIFNEVEFESILDDYLYNVKRFLNHQNLLLNNIEQIIKESEQ
jgi:hypothetical protein